MGTAENDIKFRALAERLIGDNGKTVQFNDNVLTYSVADGETTFGPDNFKTLKVSPPARYTEEQLRGELIQFGDLRAIVAAIDLEGAGITIVNQMEVIIDDETWNIESHSPIYSGDLKAAFTMQLRK